MSRSRGSEMPQKPSPRAPQLRTSSSNSDPLHNRPNTDRRSPKLGDRQSPKSALSVSVNQKRFGTRVSNLESQLGQAQEELKVLKKQLASAELEKNAAQEKLGNKTKKPSKPSAKDPVKVQKKRTPDEIPDENRCETDVFEVPMEKMRVEPKVELNQLHDQQDVGSKPISISTEPPLDTQMPTSDELASKNDEITLLKSKWEEKEKELEVFREENENLKSQLSETASERSMIRAKEEEISSSLIQLGIQLEESRDKEVELRKKLEAEKVAKEELQSEMTKLRVQTEQWRKAADAAAAVLADGVDMNGRRISERSGSMDKHFGSIYEPSVAGYTGFVGSPGLGEDLEDDFGNGKRKGSGIKMFGDLWKKKGQK
ncbi:interactor of constitutive active ROPs 4-like [Rhododendron vialii]|uniref:interactor of constitutive active ROPs 4-like n=1 Tax=Rhododendron vialii TaxID=182163 RepID=UPI00265F120A|nr:interactor of constitutive active ROPs 4-like [Rhododendron vialii]XP_058218609.1 interactor of constitutive active ROPs 4-like [Rhododendron vialii]